MGKVERERGGGEKVKAGTGEVQLDRKEWTRLCHKMTQLYGKGNGL
jgi:hypothetical protein